jgi:hypothetical protein
MSAISLAELDQLAGELLPERTVLSLVNVSVLNTSSNATYVYPSGGNGSTVAYACQATNSPGTPGLLGSLGLGSANPSSSMTCIPAAASGG